MVFFLRKLAFFTAYLSYKTLHAYDIRRWSMNAIWFPTGTFFLLASVTIALVRPYQKACMNNVDTFLLLNITLLCYAMTSGIPVLQLTRMLFHIPISVFIVTVLVRKIRQIVSKLSTNQSQKNCCKTPCFKSVTLFNEIVKLSRQDSTGNVPSEQKPFL